MTTLRLLKEVGENSVAHQVNLQPVEEELPPRVLRDALNLEDSVFGGVQAAEGEPVLGDEVSNCIHHALDGHARQLHLLEVGVQVESAPYTMRQSQLRSHISSRRAAASAQQSLRICCRVG
jgi:hypothetical protein